MYYLFIILLCNYLLLFSDCVLFCFIYYFSVLFIYYHIFNYLSFGFIYYVWLFIYYLFI